MNHWTVRVRTTTEDLDSGKLRARTETYLVEAETIEAAQTLVREYFKGMTFDHEIRSVSGSNVLEYISAETLNKK
jgi:hypothetical protein